MSGNIDTLFLPWQDGVGVVRARGPALMLAARIHRDAVVCIGRDGNATIEPFPFQGNGFTVGCSSSSFSDSGGDCRKVPKEPSSLLQKGLVATGEGGGGIQERLEIYNRLWGPVRQVTATCLGYEWQRWSNVVLVWFRCDNHLLRCEAERSADDGEDKPKGKSCWRWRKDSLVSVEVRTKRKTVDLKSSPFARECEAVLINAGEVLLNPFSARRLPQSQVGSRPKHKASMHDPLAADCLRVSLGEGGLGGARATALAYGEHPSCLILGSTKGLACVDLRASTPVQAMYASEQLGSPLRLEQCHLPSHGMLSVHKGVVAAWDSRIPDRPVAWTRAPLKAVSGAVGADAVGDTVALWSSLPGDVAVLRLGAGGSDEIGGEWRFAERIEGGFRRVQSSAQGLAAINFLKKLKQGSLAGLVTGTARKEFNSEMDDASFNFDNSGRSVGTGAGRSSVMGSSAVNTVSEDSASANSFSQAAEGSSLDEAQDDQETDLRRGDSRSVQTGDAFLKFVQPSDPLLRILYAQPRYLGADMLTHLPATGGFLAEDASKLFISNEFPTWAEYALVDGLSS